MYNYGARCPLSSPGGEAGGLDMCEKLPDDRLTEHTQFGQASGSHHVEKPGGLSLVLSINASTLYWKI